MKNKNLLHTLDPKGRDSSALLITLLMLSLITIIAVAFLGTMTWETSAARRNYENQKAQALAMLAMNTAVAQLRSAFGTGTNSWDSPYANFATNPPTFYWSVSPGLITRWSYGSATAQAQYPLFSMGSTNLVDLNAPISDGSYPIAGITNTTVPGATPPNISVYWVNVLKNPGTTAASSSNPLVGRYAFWVDDENAKININTADGTMKYQTNSLGLGSPSEVSLQALQQGGGNLATNVATNIVYLARTTGLNSPKEILRAAGAAPDLYTNNTFNLTAYSRSPDLNIFGQPKMALMPVLGQDLYTNFPAAIAQYASDMSTNGITLQAPTEIYPTPSQLPAYIVYNPVVTSHYSPWYPTPTNSVPTREPWPLAFREQEIHQNSIGRGGFDGNSGQLYTYTNSPWVNGMMLANYLAGTNAAGKLITWPPFDANTSGGFVKKYSLRQIDSIVAQILDFGSRDITPDFPAWNAAAVHYQGTRLVAPFVLMGWLSHQFVNGVGRGPKLSGLELQLTAYPATSGSSVPPITPPTPPYAIVGIWEQWWLPAGYLGGHNTVPILNDSLWQGCGNYQNVINGADLDVRGSGANVSQANFGALLPRADFISTNYWGNQVLTNNEEMDFQGNPSFRGGTTQCPDPDKASAALWHDPFARAPSTPTPPYTYLGYTSLDNKGQPYETPYALAQPSVATPAIGWAPGEIRGVPQLKTGLNIHMQMWTNAGTGSNTNLVIGGGIQQHAEYLNGSTSDPEPVPLESLRGTRVQDPTLQNGAFGGLQNLNGEFWTNSAIPYGPASPTVRDRFLQAVIPVNMNAQIPPADDPIGGISTYLRVQPADPLVNKFPGDWIPTTITKLDAWAAISWPGGTPTYSSYDEYSLGLHGTLTDPDSFWMPQLDCAQSDAATLASQTFIPRSARFPSIGYLQYLRTGIIPDDESNVSDLLHQHGTPYRLLSFAPMTDPSDARAQQTTFASSKPYPDWALLDLLYVPTTLYPFGGPYGYYDNVSNAWKGFGNPAVLASYSTRGGSSPGRINPNGMVVYTTNTATPTPNISRTIPMQALLHGLQVKQSLVQQPYTQTATTPNPGYTGTAVDDASVAQAIYNYISANGPLRMPGELCNIPAIYGLRPTVNTTRNDLIRQIIGNITTQSNTFSVWVAGQSIAKSKGNTSGLSATDSSWGLYQAGDQVLASTRYHFIVERYVDPGADGVYGNSINAGTDGVYGTYDDPVDPINHPFQPRYLYRVVSSEELR